MVGGKKYSYLFSIVNYNLTSKIEIDSQCYSICCISDGTILTGHENGYIKQYNFINKELKLIAQKKHHNGIIRVIYQLNNNLILSGSDDRTINIYIWEGVIILKYFQKLFLFNIIILQNYYYINFQKKIENPPKGYEITISNN